MNVNSSHDHATRFRSHIVPPFERLEVCKKAYLCKSIHLWNNLNAEMKESKSLFNFKNKVKHFLVEEMKPVTLRS